MINAVHFVSFVIQSGWRVPRSSPSIGIGGDLNARKNHTVPKSVSVVQTHSNRSKLKRSQIMSSDERGLIRPCSSLSPALLSDRPHWPRAWNRWCLMKLLSFQKYSGIPIFRNSRQGKENWFEKLQSSTEEKETTFASSFREVRELGIPLSLFWNLA